MARGLKERYTLEEWFTYFLKVPLHQLPDSLNPQQEVFLLNHDHEKGSAPLRRSLVNILTLSLVYLQNDEQLKALQHYTHACMTRLDGSSLNAGTYPIWAHLARRLYFSDDDILCLSKRWPDSERLQACEQLGTREAKNPLFWVDCSVPDRQSTLSIWKTLAGFTLSNFGAFRIEQLLLLVGALPKDGLGPAQSWLTHSSFVGISPTLRKILADPEWKKQRPELGAQLIFECIQRMPSHQMGAFLKSARVAAKGLPQDGELSAWVEQQQLNILTPTCPSREGSPQMKRRI